MLVVLLHSRSSGSSITGVPSVPSSLEGTLYQFLVEILQNMDMRCPMLGAIYCVLRAEQQKPMLCKKYIESKLFAKALYKVNSTVNSVTL